MELKDTVEDMTSCCYKKRFKAEYNQLKIRYEKLNDLVHKSIDGALDFIPTCPMELLIKQCDTMRQYLEILRDRAYLENIKL